jgi:uridine kinase
MRTYFVSFSCQVLNKEELEHAHSNNYNFDIPAAFDFELLISSLKRLKDGKKIEVYQDSHGYIIIGMGIL